MTIDALPSAAVVLKAMEDLEGFPADAEVEVWMEMKAGHLDLVVAADELLSWADDNEMHRRPAEQARRGLVLLREISPSKAIKLQIKSRLELLASRKASIHDPSPGH
jgi:hypothetical protein